MVAIPKEMEIELLADHSESIPMLTDWYVTEWEPYYGVNGPGDARADLESRRNREEVPIGFVATEDGEVYGVAALDRDTVTGLTPSVVGLLVSSSQRGRGIATDLLESAESLAKRLGYRRLYVSTTVLGGLLIRMGWYSLGEVEFVNGERGSIYARDL